MLSRGQRLDWFESTEIMLEAFIAALAFYLFIAHSVTARAPFLSPRLVKDRNYAIGAFLIVIFGMLNFTPMVLLPSLLQNQLGFPDGLIGYVVSWRGMGVMCGFFSAMVTTRLDVRVGMVVGFGTQIVSGIWLTSIDFNVSLFTLCANAFMQGLAVGLIWTPIATSAFWTLDPSLRADGVAVFHLMRNIGSSFFISISVAEVVRATGANYSRMTEMISPYNTTLSLPWVTGAWDFGSVAGLAKVAKEINRQAAMIGYLNAFVMYSIASGLGLLLVLTVRRRRSTLARA
jgi:DHA2 family multidrug resistance protein